MSSHDISRPPSADPGHPEDRPVMEGAPRGSGRPSWPGLVVAIVMALAAGAGLGYGVASVPIPTPNPSPTPTPSSSPVPTPAATPLPPVAGFTTFARPAADAVWSGLEWLRLSAGNTLANVAFTRRWSNGYIAVGQPTTGTDSARTPVWVSSEGVLWQALDPDVFGPSAVVVGVAEGPSGLVALSVQSGANECAPSGDCWTITGPMQIWTSPFGTSWSWTSHPGPDLVLPRESSNPRLVVGPAGFLAAVPDEWIGGPGQTQAAISADGVTWETLSPGTFPAGFQLGDLYGTSAGYLAVGTQVEPQREDKAALWSTDGRHWVATGPMPTASRAGIALAAYPVIWTTVVGGRDGFIVSGGAEAVQGTQLWWQSGDGQHWQLLSGYPPLGAVPYQVMGAGTQPYGVLLGDGQRMVAVRGGSQAAAWSSADGKTWTKLAISGDVPNEQATTAALFPGGVLLSDGTNSWYGRATTR